MFRVSLVGHHIPIGDGRVGEIGMDSLAYACRSRFVEVARHSEVEDKVMASVIVTVIRGCAVLVEILSEFSLHLGKGSLDGTQDFFAVLSSSEANILATSL